MTGYLRKTNEAAKLRGGVQLATLSLDLGVPPGRAEITRYGLGEGIGWLPAFPCALGIWRGNRLQSLWGEFSTTAGFCFLPPSPTVSGTLLVRAADALGPY